MSKVITSVFCGALILFLILSPETTHNIISLTSTKVLVGFGRITQWLLFISLTLGLIFCASSTSKERIGSATTTEFNFLSWQSLIICTLLAGGGLFWSAAEPIYHYLNPSNALPGVDPKIAGLTLSHFHWGFSAWSVLGSLGVVSLHMAEKAGLPLRPRSLLHPFCSKSMINSILGDIVDGVCFLAVVTGTVGPIGFLGIQISYLLTDLYGAPKSILIEVGTVILLTVLYTSSALSGVSKGMKWLSVLNVGLSLFLGLFVFLLNSPIELIGFHLLAQKTLVTSFVDLSLLNLDSGWMKNWTWFYWTWFIGYAPMMSVIVARISRGRTLRQVILSVSLFCPLMTNIWFSIIGGSLFTLPNLDTSIADQINSAGLPAALSILIQNLPLSFFTGILFIFLIFTFLATTGDSVSFSLSMASEQTLTPKPKERLFWCFSIAALSIVLLVIGGTDAITSFQSVIIITAVPVSLIMILPILNAMKIISREIKSKFKS